MKEESENIPFRWKRTKSITGDPTYVSFAITSTSGGRTSMGCFVLGLEQIQRAWLEEARLDSLLKNKREDSLVVIESEHAQLCGLLLRHGADPNMNDFQEMSPLDLVTALLKAGACPNYTLPRPTIIP